MLTIISGGQTGVDRAALDAAITRGIPHGGWCPRGRLAEDGRIPDRYQFRETDSPVYAVRTKQNVLDSDATLVVCRGAPRGGTELTCRLAREYHKPCLVVDLSGPISDTEIHSWLKENRVQTLNVAGPRESQSPGIGAATFEFLWRVLADINRPG